MKKLSINLYREELKVATPLVTLPRVVSLWIALLLIMSMWSLFTSQQLSVQLVELEKAEATKLQQNNRIKQLEQQVSNNKASTDLLNKLKKIEFVIANKQQLLKQLTNKETTYTAGYSQAMTELSDLHHKDVSLTGVNITPNAMTFSGIARNPDAVPGWLARFEGATFLKGQSFSYMNLQENEQKYTQFVVSSSAELNGGTAQ